jgi:hypothetical protein
MAASVDRLMDNRITVEVSNIANESVTIDSDTIMGTVETIDECEEAMFEPEDTSAYPITIDKGNEWLKKIEIGDDDTPASEKERIKNLIQQYEDCFSKHNNDLGRTNLIQHQIEL